MRAPLRYCGRFNEHMSLEFASEVLRQIQRQLDSRDDRGRPLIQARDAQLIADTARTAVASLASHEEHVACGKSRFDDSPTLGFLISAASRRVLSDRIEKFDLRQPDRFLPAEAVEELIHAECQALLEENMAHPELGAVITDLIGLDKAAAMMLEDGAINLPRCSYDRRTLVFVPTDDVQQASCRTFAIGEAARGDRAGGRR